MTLLLNDHQRDCLQEISNVALGHTADHLAKAFKVFVTLPIPRIVEVTTDHLAGAIKAYDVGEKLYLASQRFTVGAEDDATAFTGLALVALDEPSRGLVHEVRPEASDERLSINSHQHIAAPCLSLLAEQLELPLHCEAAIYSGHQRLADAAPQWVQGMSQLVVVEIHYQFENSVFNGDLILIFADEHIEVLMERLDYLLT